MVKRLEDSVFDDLRQLRAENESLKKQRDMDTECITRLQNKGLELEQQLAQARGQTLEEAAKACEEVARKVTQVGEAYLCANRIRALSPPTEAKSDE